MGFDAAGSARLCSALVRGSTPKVYSGFGHGLCAIRRRVVTPDLLTFFKA